MDLKKLSEPNTKQLFSKREWLLFLFFGTKRFVFKKLQDGRNGEKTVTTVERWTFVSFAVATRRMIRIGKSEHRSGGFLRSFAVAAGPFIIEQRRIFLGAAAPKKMRNWSDYKRTPPVRG